MSAIRWLQFGILLLALSFSVHAASADSVQLANGDVLNGRVLGLDEKHLRLESETLGQLNVPRGKIVSIHFGNQKPTVVALPKPGAAGTNLTPEDVVKQFKATGVNPRDIGDVQKMLPLLATPEASRYFDDTLKGLLGGTRNVGDIRKDAIRARDELKKATKGLGPDVEAGIAPYLNILERFIGETNPPAPETKANKAGQPAKK